MPPGEDRIDLRSRELSIADVDAWLTNHASQSGSGMGSAVNAGNETTLANPTLASPQASAFAFL